jgi:hypothetical protein
MIKGLDQLQKQLHQAQEALRLVEGDLGTVSFDPNDPESIEAAMRQIDALIDERLGDYLQNPIIGPLAESMKEKYREAVLEQAQAKRLEGDVSNG